MRETLSGKDGVDSKLEFLRQISNAATTYFVIDLHFSNFLKKKREEVQGVKRIKKQGS